ncbi:MAG: phytoene desaturase family protein [Promethearchaeota archaeon]
MNKINVLDSTSNSIYDGIIIGAGIGGLVAGNILQKKGYKVLILEKNDYPGGYCTNFKRKDFNFDVNLHWTCGCEKGGIVYNVLEKFNGENCVEFIKLKELYHWIDQQNNISYRASTSLPEYIETLIKIFPHEEAEIRQFFDLYSNIFDATVIQRLSDKKVFEIIDPHFSNPILKNAILAPLGFFGWPPNELSASFMAAFSMTYFKQGAYYIKGGAGKFSNALADLFIKNGGILIFGTEVIKLIFEGKTVSGVIVEDKEKNRRTYYSNMIIANCNPVMLVSNLSSKGVFPSVYVNNIKSRVPSLSAVNLYLGLDIDLKSYEISDYMIWTPLYRNNSIDDLKENLEMANYSKLPVGSTTIYSNIDPTCCPEGKSVISVLSYAKLDPFENKFNLKETKNDEYNKFKTKIAEQLIGTISKILKIPDLKSHIEVIELATPITFRHYSHNPSGSIMGWQMTPEQFIQNPLSQKTPIENLFLCGQWASRTGGLPAVIGSADAATEYAIKYFKRKKK